MQNVTLLLMGTADELPVEPVMKTMFVEDMTESQLARAVSLIVIDL
jgi:ubiquitin carboxyl-terminal hydrolase 14